VATLCHPEPGCHFEIEYFVFTQVVQVSDIKEFFIGKAEAEVSRQIRRLIDRNMLVS